MANEFSYNFDRISVLVVEDNAYMKMLLASLLKDLGFGWVEAASDGGEAIEFLKLVATDSQRAGIQSLDIIISNWQMAPVDGLELLRWVRRNKQSPDRFIPFVFITAFADLPKLRQARDAGVTEFMAKPYTIATLCDRVLAVVDRPRQYVSTPKFFGPDRRRRATEVEGVERRDVDDDDADIVYEAEA